MLIVCAVLTALATMSWPAMRGMLSKGRLKQAAADLEATLHRTRIRAVESGTTLVVSYVPGGRTYRIEPGDAMHRDETFELTGEVPTAGAPADEASAPRLSSITKELPQGVTFASASSESAEASQDIGRAVDRDTSVAAGSHRYGDVSAPEWSEPIAFHANGRSEDAEIRLVDERRFFVDVTVRGLTGRVKSTTPARLPLDPTRITADDARPVTPEREEVAR